MVKRIFVLIIVILELLICIVLCAHTNTKKYDPWPETTALVNDVMLSFTPGTRNSNPYSGTVSVSYLDTEHIFMLYYTPKLQKGDEITIKYHPENKKEIVYLPNEEKRISRVRFFILLFFIPLIFLTASFGMIRIINKEEDKVIAQIETEFNDV